MFENKLVKKIANFLNLKELGKRAITVIILTLTAIITVWVYAAFVEPLAGPNDSDQDFAQNILGANNNNNDFSSSNVASNADGSIIERQEYLQTQINTNLDATVSSRLAAASYTAERGTDNAALDSEVGGASDAASMSTTLFAGQQYIADNMAPILGYQEYTSGSGNWTVPTGVNFVDAVIVAGGGGSSSAATAGGGGEVVIRKNYKVTPGASIAYVVGAGGSSSGGNGGNSSFSGITAEGGYGSATGFGIGGGSGGSGVPVVAGSNMAANGYAVLFGTNAADANLYNHIGGLSSVITGYHAAMGLTISTPFGSRSGGGGGGSETNTRHGGNSAFGTATAGGGGASWGNGAAIGTAGAANSGAGAGAGVAGRAGGSGYILITWRK